MPWSNAAVAQGSFSTPYSDNGTVSLEEAIKHPERFYGIGNASAPTRLNWSTKPYRDWSNYSYTNLWNVNQDGATITSTNTGNDPVTGYPIFTPFRVNMIVSLDVGKTVYDPSPVGFKVPPTGAYPEQMDVGSYQQGRGVYMSAGGSVSALYQVAGYRNHSNGSVTLDQDDYDNQMAKNPPSEARHGGWYWTAAPSAGVDSNNQYLDSESFSIRLEYRNNSDNGVSSQPTSFRARGYSIRPVRE
jgi:hypothetical protein